MRYRVGGIAGLAITLQLAVASPGVAQAPSSEAIGLQVEHPTVVSRHDGTFNGAAIHYAATVEHTLVDGGPHDASAQIVSFAYTKDGADPTKRPVVFLFNGGPIVPSLYVHLGLGPMRVAFPNDIQAPSSSFKLVDNPFSPLDAADLVFVDPASTGFSRAAPGTDPRAYFSVKADAQQFAAFIRTWMKAHGRTGAPAYLFGESYGTNRAAEIAGQLADGPDPYPLAGVFIYGQAVNIIEYAQRPANIISYVASLPTIAAIGWYHGKAQAHGRSFEQYLADARAFAKGPYLTALYLGSDLPKAARLRIARRLQAFSGIPAAWYLDHGLKITKEQYRVELLKDRGLVLGRDDARYTAPVTAAGGAADPSGLLPVAMQTNFVAYLRDELKVDWPDSYVTSPPITGLNDWAWGDGESPFADWPYAAGLSKMMKLNPRFHLVIGNGYYDINTTLGAAELLATQYGWDKDRVRLRYYDGGHMGYSVAATAKAIADDIRQMVR